MLGWTTAGSRRTASRRGVTYSGLAPASYTSTCKEQQQRVWCDAQWRCASVVDPPCGPPGGSEPLARCSCRRAACWGWLAHSAGSAIHQVVESQVGERTRALAVATEQAEAANGPKSESLANMTMNAHPLNGILGYAQILQRQAGYSAVRQDGLRTIYERAAPAQPDHDVLDLAKIEARRWSCTPGVHLPNPSWRGSPGSSVAAVQKNLAFSSCRAELPASVWADDGSAPDPADLLGNAVKFTGTRHVSLRISRVDRTSPVVPARAACLRFEVEAPARASRRNNRRRSSCPSSRPARQAPDAGTGLGLAISAILVELMGAGSRCAASRGGGAPSGSNPSERPDAISATEYRCAPDRIHGGRR